MHERAPKISNSLFYNFEISCRNVGLNLKFPQLNVFYWGSVAKQLGAELNLGTGSLNMMYRVGLLNYKDGLIRRPAATWTIVKLDSEIDDVTCYVTGVEEKEPTKETGQQSTPTQVCILLR